MMLHTLFPEDQARAMAAKAMALSWSEGKARTPQLTGTVKQNSEILNHTIGQAVGKRIVGDGQIQLHHIPLKILPPKLSKYESGQHYKLHTDAPWMQDVRTDLACTLWLNDDYEGGMLKIGDSPGIKGKPGQCLIYECGEPHEVTPVTAGARICAITWMQSRIRDAHKRRLATLMRQFLAKFEDDQTLFVEGSRIHSALLRLWIE